MTSAGDQGPAPQTAQQLSESERLMVARLLRDRGRQRTLTTPRRDRSLPSPASPAQHQLWLAEQIGQGGARYNIPYALRITGDVEPRLVEAAITEIRRRHEILRTTYRLDGPVLIQETNPDPAAMLEVHDLTATAEPDRLAVAVRLARASAATSFDLDRGPVMRAQLYGLSPGDALLVLIVHHIATDAWSAAILMNELASAYTVAKTGAASTLPEPAAQYADIVAWLQEPGQRAEEEVGLEYWRARLADSPEPAQLPCDFPRQPARDRRGDRIQVTLPQATANAVKNSAGALGTTTTAVLLAAYAVVIARCTGEDDVIIGTSAANRPTVESESLIGYFANTLPLRVCVPPHTELGQLARHAHRVLREAAAHQGVPFARIVGECAPARPAASTPFFRNMFVHQTMPMPELAAPGLLVRPVEIHNGTAKFDLDLSIIERQDDLVASLEYDSGLFLPDTARRLLSMLGMVLSQIGSEPRCTVAAANLLSAGERRMITGAWNSTAARFPDRCLHELFEDQVDRDPSHTAVIHGKHRASYLEVEEQANQVARWLRDRGVRRNSVVGICVTRSADMVTGLLGILKAGGAYLPLDPAYPAQRLAYMTQDSGLAALIGHELALKKIPAQGVPVLCLDADRDILAGEPTARPRPIAAPGGLAYVIYTSGSTGHPKGILADHRGRVSNFTDFNTRFGVGPADSVLAVSSLSFDMCAYDVFGTLAAGGTIVLPDEGQLRSPGHLAELISRHCVTLWHSVPALAGLLADHIEHGGAGPLPLRLALLGGDWIPVSLPARLALAAPGLQAVALGGATEVSMDSTLHLVTGDDAGAMSIPYGRPMANQLAYVVDAAGDLQPIGACGELALGGVGVTWGYLGRSALTAEKFVPNPYSGVPGDRMYRTGDVARWRPDGELQLLGRQDRQVKIAGYRVELGEIEAAIARLPAVRDAAVIVAAPPGGGTRLAAFVVPADDAAPSLAAELPGKLAERLPGYMIPPSWQLIENFPITPNGKVDRAALARQASQVRADAYAAPRTSTEQLLAELLAALLGVDKVGADDNFFQLGGDSVRAIQLAARAAERGLVIDVGDIFEAQTLAALAERVRTGRPSSGRTAESAACPPRETKVGTGGRTREQTPRHATLPLSPFQRHMLAEQEDSDLPGLFVIQSATPLPGSVDPVTLREAWRSLQRRHDALRFKPRRVEGRWIPEIATAPLSDLVVHDWLGMDPGAQEQAARALIASERELIRPGGPLLRLHLLRLAQELSLLLDMHHYLLFDGWSSAILNSELIALYGSEPVGSAAGLPAPASCLGYLSWLGDQDEAKHVGYWRLRLSGLDHRSWLSPGTGRCAQPYRKHMAPIGERRLAGLSARAREWRTTTWSLIITAWSVLLSAACDQDDVVFGAVSSGRPTGLANVESIVGQLVQVLPLRARVGDDLTLSGLCRQVAGERAQDTRYELVSPGAARDIAFADEAPLFDHVLVFDNYPAHDEATRRVLDATDGELPSALDFNINQIEGTLRIDVAVSGGGVLAFSFDPACYSLDRVHVLTEALFVALDHVIGPSDCRVGELRERLAALLHRNPCSPSPAKELLP